MAEITQIDSVAKDSIQYIVVKIGSEHYGIDISYIDNIVRMTKITRVPKAPFHYRGIMNLRGEIVPVMSIRRRMGLEDDEFTDASRIIILKFEQQGLVGVVVDEVNEVLTLANDEIDRASKSTKGGKNSFINGVGKNGNELISIFAIDSIVEDVEVS